MGEVKFLLGNPHSGKTARCLSAYAEALRASAPTTKFGSTLWLTPAQESRHAVLERLVPLTGGVIFQPNVLTFDQFAERVLVETGQGDRVITSFVRRLILRAIIRQVAADGELRHFRKIAGTEGFVDIISSFVSELKRAEIWPHEFQAACRQLNSRVSERDAEVHLIYERYQDILHKGNWYDAEGRFWLARDALQKRDGFWRGLSLVVVDGFSDFTRTQQEMLQRLAFFARSMLITLPMESSRPARRELFSKPLGMLTELRRRFQDVGEVTTDVCESSDNDVPGGLMQIREQLFVNPRLVTPILDGGGFEIVSAMGDESEKSAVAFRIKRLLQEGVLPREIVVGMRAISVDGQSWGRALTDAGIPAWCEAPPPWSRSPYLKALFALLQLKLEDWPFERLQGILNSTLFRPQYDDWQPILSPCRITRLLRRGKLHSRQAAILDGLNRRLARAEKDDAPERRSDLKFALRVLNDLANACDVLGGAHALADWADRIAMVSKRLGLSRGPADNPDRRDAEQLQKLLRAAAAVEAELVGSPPARTLEELRTILQDVIQADPPAGSGNPSGCVRIVGVETLRHLSARYVFLVSVTEDAFPSRRADDCLLSDAERVRFHEAGLSLMHREQHQRDEMLLFYQAATRPAAKLTLSYSQVDGQGHEVFPSPYLTAAEELFAPAANVRSACEGSLEPLPSDDRILTPTHVRLAAVLQGRRKEGGWWKTLLQDEATAPAARNVLAAAQVAARRYHTEGFTAYEGRLGQARNLAHLAALFGPERQFSATELEKYAACPFQFWMSSVLKVQPLPSPEEATDHAARGSLVHEVLANLSNELDQDAERVSRRFLELAEAKLRREGVAENELQQALLETERRMLARLADAFASQNEEYRNDLASQEIAVQRVLGEIPFGEARDADASDPHERHPALELQYGDMTIRLGGRIDRVDISELDGRVIFNVIDYKTGSLPRFKWAEVLAGRLLQLALYTLTVGKLKIAGPNAVAHQMGYWGVKRGGFSKCGDAKSEMKIDIAARESLEQALSETIGRLVSGIRSGVFVVDNPDDECTSRCDYRTVCRVNHIRSLAEHLKKVRPEPLSPPNREPG